MKEISFFVSVPADYHMPFYKFLLEQGVRLKVYYYNVGETPVCPGVDFIPIKISPLYKYNSRKFDNCVSILNSFKIISSSRNIVIHGWSSPYWISLIILAVFLRKRFFFLNDLNSMCIENGSRFSLKGCLKKVFLKMIYFFSRGAICTSIENEDFTLLISDRNEIFSISWHAMYIDEFIKTNGDISCRTEDADFKSMYIGRYEEHKGIKNVVSYFEKGESGVLNLYGFGSYRIPKCINIIDNGRYNPRQLVEIIKPGDLCIFPSEYEPLGLAILEAASLGAIIVSSKKIVAAKEVFSESKAGVSFFDSQSEMENQIASILSLDSDSRVRMGLGNSLCVKEWATERKAQAIDEVNRLFQNV